MDVHDVIKRPIITEKATRLADGNKFVFEVGRFCNKQMIKKAIEQAFRVNVVHVATMIVKGRTKRVGTRRTESKQSPWKKAVVTVKSGDKIDLFSAGAQ